MIGAQVQEFLSQDEVDALLGYKAGPHSAYKKLDKTLTLTCTELDYIYKILCTMPYNQVDGIIAKIREAYNKENV